MCIDVGTFRQLNKQLQHSAFHAICTAQEAPVQQSSQLPQPCWQHWDTDVAKAPPEPLVQPGSSRTSRSGCTPPSLPMLPALFKTEATF